METIILGLGSNRGDSKTILAGAVNRLASFLYELRTSSLYITKPQDFIDQNDFYNMAVAGLYEGRPTSLLAMLQQIEADYGRNRDAEMPKGPRTLDIAILFFGNWSSILLSAIPLHTSRLPTYSPPFPIKGYEKAIENARGLLLGIQQRWYYRTDHVTDILVNAN